MPVTLPLVIDRIHMTVGVTIKEHYGLIISQLHEMLAMQGDLLPTGKLKLKKEQYLTQLNFWPSKNRKIAEIAVGSTKSEHRYFKLVLYPAKFRADEFVILKGSLDVLLSEWSYGTLFKTANVSYLEIARDFVNKDCTDYLPYHPNARKSEVFTEHGGVKGSTYIGAASSSRRFCVYDKAKQLTKKQGGSNFKKLMRVEVRLKKTGFKPFELLSELANPFEGLQVLSVSKMLGISQEDAWLAFVEQCRCVGTAQALAGCCKKTRKVYKARLKVVSVDWWDSCQTWSGWPNASTSILP